jgi:hypothetical protein
MTQFRAVLLGHRDAALAGLGRVPTSPKALAAAEAITAIMRLGGLTDRVVALGLDQLILYVSACAFEASVYENKGMTDAELARYFADVHAYYDALPPSIFPTLAQLSPDMTGPDADERFQFGLEVLIAGYEALSHSA